MGKCLVGEIQLWKLRVRVDANHDTVYVHVAQGISTRGDSRKVAPF